MDILMLGKWGIGRIHFLIIISVLIVLFLGATIPVQADHSELKSCPDGYELELGACYSDGIFECEKGTTYNVGTSSCVNGKFSCQSPPFSYDQKDGMCYYLEPPSPLIDPFQCMQGGNYIDQTARCQQRPDCPDGFTFTLSSGQGYCEKPRDYQCSDDSLDTGQKCQISVCGNEQRYSADQTFGTAFCYAKANVECPKGFDVERGLIVDKCTTKNKCPSGSEPTLLGDCEAPKKKICPPNTSPFADNPLFCSSFSECPSGDKRSVDGNCERAKSCPSGTTEVAGICTAAVKVSCPSGTTEIAGICTASVKTSVSCPSGFSPEGLVCTKSPSRSNHSHCDIPDPFGGSCVVSSNHVHLSCSSGTLNVFGKCETAKITKRTCPSGTTDNGVNCTSTAKRTCPAGTTDRGVNCTSDGSCPSGYTKGAFVCYKSASCPTGTTRTVNYCTVDVKFDCSYLETNKDGKATFQEIAFVCFKEDGACPTDSVWYIDECIVQSESSTCPSGYNRYLLPGPQDPMPDDKPGEASSGDPYQCRIEASKHETKMSVDDPTIPDDGVTAPGGEFSILPIDPELGNGLMEPEVVIPSWVKDIAAFWCADEIGSGDFVQVIQWMIKEGLIMVPQDSVTTQTSTSSGVPDWIQFNACIWHQGEIGDKEFSTTLQWLIDNGIIKI